jgi:hypothetical protein
MKFWHSQQAFDGQRFALLVPALSGLGEANERR